jgi:hypothetical protein
LVLANLVSTWYLVGLIWTIQIVHYNLFDRVGSEGFARYEADHTRLITPIVGPPMLLELGTAAALVFFPPQGTVRWMWMVGLIAVVLIWMSTAFIQIPCHNRLATGFDSEAYRWLVGSNWIRTVLWTVRGVGIAYLTAKLFKL